MRMLLVVFLFCNICPATTTISLPPDSLVLVIDSGSAIPFFATDSLLNSFGYKKISWEGFSFYTDSDRRIRSGNIRFVIYQRIRSSSKANDTLKEKYVLHLLEFSGAKEFKKFCKLNGINYNKSFGAWYLGNLKIRKQTSNDKDLHRLILPKITADTLSKSANVYIFN
jgi:hypothetical protein